MSQDVLLSCEEAIRELLADHVEAPLKNTREEDFRASLLSALRKKFPERALVELWDSKQDKSVPLGSKPRETSLVHAEVKLGGDEKKGNEKARVDLVVLNDMVELKIKRGMTDVQASIRPKDVAAVIELKAAPFGWMREGIKKDLKKMSHLLERVPNLKCFLVIIDKSISLGLADDGQEDSRRIRKLEGFLKKIVKRHSEAVRIYYLGRKNVPTLFNMPAA